MTGRRRGWGEGAVFYQEGKRCWVGRLELEPTADGRRRSRWVYGSTRREVVDRLDELKAELRQGIEPATQARKRTTVGDVLQEWLESLGAGAGKKRPLTRVRYAIDARTMVAPRLGHVPIGRLDADTIERWQDQLLEAGYAPRSVWKARTILSAVIKRARRKRPPLLRENPLELVDPPAASPPDRRALSAEEARRFLVTMHGHRLEPLLLLGLLLGMRKGEILGLQWTDLDVETGTLAVRRQLQRIPGQGLVLSEPKSAAGSRVVPLPSMLVEALRGHRARQLDDGGPIPIDGLMFGSSTGTPMEPRNLVRDFKALVKRADVGPLSIHELRHSASTVLQVLGVPPLVVAQLLGHADPSVTLRSYGHIVPEAHRDAMARMDAYIRGLVNEERVDVSGGRGPF